ncbi:MAG: phospholipid carrier-dependent glycosyltransferase, partial [Sphingomonadaceae bacterium]|nr:phospholipid carrier-dependent glycosyltransferase [Sphingomonadaceae bacterium]
LLGNPLTMLLGLPALLWCLWAGIVQRRRDTLAVFVLYAASLGFWIIAAKPVQFYYHYLLPSCFLLIALALALDALWQRGKRRLPIAALVASCALFGWFYPILSAAPLEGPGSFAHWMWLDSWR